MQLLWFIQILRVRFSLQQENQAKIQFVNRKKLQKYVHCLSSVKTYSNFRRKNPLGFVRIKMQRILSFSRTLVNFNFYNQIKILVRQKWKKYFNVCKNGGEWNTFYIIFHVFLQCIKTLIFHDFTLFLCWCPHLLIVFRQFHTYWFKFISII